MNAATTMLARGLRGRSYVHIGLLSALEMLPYMLSGLTVSMAIDRFSSGDLVGGLAGLAVLLAAAVLAAVATRQLLTLVASIVEPARDALLTGAVEGAIEGAVEGAMARTGDRVVVPRLLEQIESIRHALFTLLRNGRRALLMIVAAIAGLAMLTPAVAAVAAMLAAGSLALLAWRLPRLAVRHRTMLAAEREVEAAAATVFGALQDCVAASGEQRAAGEIAAAAERHATTGRAFARTGTIGGLAVLLGGQLPLVVLLAGAPLLLRGEGLSVGAMVGAAVYLAAGLEPAMRGLAGIVTGPGMVLTTGLHELGQAFPPPAPPSPGRVRTLAAHDLTLHRLTFGYGPHATPVFKNLNLTLADGGHLAVIGPAGIGKSTLANLLAGLLEPRRGTIRMAGVNLHRIDRADLRRLIALVPREAYVFAGTLRDNLTYLAPAADRHDIDESVAALGLGPVVERIGGLDTPVGAGGAHLSPGERQLVALARVHLSPARIVILDEATAELDPLAEARAEAALAARGGSLVVVAHRIGSALRARSVLLLDGDRVRLTGSTFCADLIGRSGRGEQCPVRAET